jgi:hypothetical protein
MYVFPSYEVWIAKLEGLIDILTDGLSATCASGPQTVPTN